MFYIHFFWKYFYDEKDLRVFYFHVTIYEKIMQLLFFSLFLLVFAMAYLKN